MKKPSRAPCTLSRSTGRSQLRGKSSVSLGRKGMAQEGVGHCQHQLLGTGRLHPAPSWAQVGLEAIPTALHGE